MIFDFTILLHNEKENPKTICDIVFMADEIVPIENDLKDIFQNKISKNTDNPSFSVALNLWTSYPENIDFQKSKNINSKSLTNEYKKLLYTNNITADDFKHISLSKLFDFVFENLKTMDFQAHTFLKEILINQIEVVDSKSL